MDWIGDVVKGSLSAGAAIFFARLWMNEIKDRVVKVEEYQRKTQSDFLDKVFELQNKVAEVLDLVILKFNDWEDRTNSKINARLTSLTSETGSVDISQKLKAWDDATKKDVAQIKEVLQGITKDIAKLDKEVGANKKQNTYGFKISNIEAGLNKLKASVGTMDAMVQGRIQRNDEMIKAAYKVMISFNDKNARLERKLDAFIKASRTKIKLN